MNMTMAARIISVSVIPRWLWFRNPGTGRPSILWPMVRYMRIARNTMDQMRRRFSLGVS